MPVTRISCPRCRQPVTAEINQLFDMNVDPEAKQKLLSGQFNVIRCPNCGYEGNASTPVVYHDPDKELLLTYFPPELGLPMNEQERLIGPLLTQVMNKLPPEKRKAYLLRPQTMMTFQTMVERILEGEGITKEMIQEQQLRLNLVQRLLTATPEVRVEIAKQEDAKIDEAFFTILNRLMEASLGSGDEESARQIADLQQSLLPVTTVGRQLQEQAQETEAALKSLQEASQKGLTRESLLGLMADAPTDARISALAGMTRSALDYNFFQLLTQRIDSAEGEQKERLTGLREKLLQITKEIDEEMSRQMQSVRALLDTLLAAPNVQQATVEHIQEIDNLFVENLRAELQKARQENNQDRFQKLQQIVTVLQQASAPPPEFALVEEMMAAENDTDLRKVMTENKERLTDEFIQFLGGLVTQTEQQPQGQDPQVIERLRDVHRAALRFSMESKLNG